MTADLYAPVSAASPELITRTTRTSIVTVPLGAGLTGREISRALSWFGFRPEQVHASGIFRLRCDPEGGWPEIAVEVPPPKAGDRYDTFLTIDPDERYAWVALVWKLEVACREPLQQIYPEQDRIPGAPSALPAPVQHAKSALMGATSPS